MRAQRGPRLGRGVPPQEKPETEPWRCSFLSIVKDKHRHRPPGGQVSVPQSLRVLAPRNIPARSPPQDISTDEPEGWCAGRGARDGSVFTPTQEGCPV